MYSNLSKKEKQKKLAQARKRAVQWSAQQQVRTTLRKTASLKKSSTPTTQSIPTSHQPMDLSFNTPIQLEDNRTSTTQAIRETLKDLQDQREAIDITIKVLTQRLKFLLEQESSPK